MWASLNEIGWVEIAAQLTVEFLLQNIMLECIFGSGYNYA